MEPYEDKEFSAIKFYRLLEAAVHKVDTYPLTKDNLVVQQDAYRRLAMLDEDSEEWASVAHEPFATIDCSRKEHDDSLRFIMAFAPAGFELAMEGVGTMFFHYHIFSSEASASKQVLAVLTMLCNGQLTSLVTHRGNRICASEIVLMGPGQQEPVVLATEAHYPWYWQTYDTTGYDAIQLRNRYIEGAIPIPRELFILERTEKGALVTKGRDFPNGEITPLSKALYRHYFTEDEMRQAGRDADKSDYIWLRFDDALPQILSTLLRMAIPALLLASTFWPIYVLRSSGDIATWYELPVSPPIIYSAAALTVLALVLSFFRGVVTASVYISTVWAATIIMFVTNFVVTDADASAPEPYSAIAVCTYLFGSFIASYIGWRAIRASSQEKEKFSWAAMVHNENKTQMLVKYVRTLELGIVSVCLAILVGAAWLFNITLPDSSMVYNNTTAICIGICAAAVLMGAATAQFAIGKIGPKRYYWTIMLVSIATMFLFALSIKDNVYQGPGLPWAMLAFSLLAIMAVVALADVVDNRLRIKELNAQAFTPGHYADNKDANFNECVVLTIYSDSPEGFQNKMEQHAIQEFEDALELALPHDAFMDGDGFSNFECDVYIYGQSADSIWKVIQPLVKQSPFTKVDARLYHGSTDDPQTKVTKKTHRKKTA